MMNLKGKFYRVIMKIAHRFNWHYAPPIYVDGDTVLWCKWCGFRELIKVSPKNVKTVSYHASQCLGILKRLSENIETIKNTYDQSHDKGTNQEKGEIK